ncbi:MAG: ABC transporter permease [Tissierellia bacterium]|nr:ABC transporter permease [Tissierellia bacterium]
MKKIIFSKFIQIIFTLWIATFSVFLLIQSAPSDPITIFMSQPAEYAVDQDLLNEQIEQLKEEYHLNDNVFKQYTIWLGRILRFDLGKSLLTGQSVRDSIKRSLPNSLKLAFFSMIIQFVLATMLAILSVMHFSKPIDHLIRFITVAIRSVPSFAIGLVLLTYFATHLKIYEISTSNSMSRLWLPVLAAGITMIPKLTRLIRSSVLDEMGKLYIVSYISKGFNRAFIIKQALKNILIPISTQLAISFAGSVGGMIITEAIFSWPGIGKFGMDSIISQDYPAIQGYILVITFLVIIINFLSDIVYIYANPMARREAGAI